MPDEITCDVPGPSSNHCLRADRVFDHYFIDCLRPLFPSEGSKPKVNYAFVAVDSFSRFPFCVPLKKLTAKSVCDALSSLWQFTGCCSYISSDLGTNFTSQCDVYVGGKVSVLELMRFFYLKHSGSKINFVL